MNSSARLGYLYVALSAVLFAATGTASKFLFLGGVTPYQLVQIRTAVASAVLLAWLALADPSCLRIPRQSLPRFILLGFVLAATMFTYFYAISKIQVAAAILLQYQSPVLVAAYALAFSRERHSPATVLAIAGSGLGCYLAVGAYSLDLLSLNRAGIAGGLGAAAFLSGYTVLSESALRRHKPWTVLFYASLFSAAACNLLHEPFEGLTRSYDAVQWFWILFISVVGTAISLGLYNKGLRLIRSTHASITATLQPIAAAVIAFLVLGETMNVWQVAGVFLVVASITLLQVGKNRR
ncbi:MAG: DMT family transporter [Syntrophales bacterium]|nr:DMT family transporter [Syntrophales bacterium]